MTSKTHDSRYIELVSRLRNARKAMGLSQKELGAKIGQPQTFISKVETCERRLDVIETAELCVILGICICDVLPPTLLSLLPEKCQ